jgi:hypothetical protein
MSDVVALRPHPEPDDDNVDNYVEHASLALRAAYQAKIRELEGDVRWAARMIAYHRSERDTYGMVEVHQKERGMKQPKIRAMHRVLKVIDRCRARLAVPDEF